MASTKILESILDGAYTRMLGVIVNISWRQHPTKSQFYGPIPDISTILRERRVHFAGHCWRVKQDLASGSLLLTPSHGARRFSRLAITYIDQVCYGSGCHPNDPSTLMKDSNGWDLRRITVQNNSTE